MSNATCSKAIFAVVALISFAPAANAITYTTSGAPEQFSLGNTLGLASDYDRLKINGSSGQFIDGQSIVLNSLEFVAGVNAIVPQVYNNVFSFTESVKLSDGVGTTFTVPFNLSINYSDTLTIIGTTFSFVDGGSLWQVAVNGLTLGPNPGGSMFANLTAQVTDPPGVSQVPLPAALPLFVSGLGALGLLGRWRKRKNAAPVAAA
jgi:hypothetical protein